MVAKWLNATDCRSVLNKFVGSNPTHFRGKRRWQRKGKVVQMHRGRINQKNIARRGTVKKS